MPLPTIDFVAARRLCTEPELRILQASARERLHRLSVRALKRNITAARKLRDAWQDQSTRLRRPEPAEEHSELLSPTALRRKADLFAAAVSRFEAQLGKRGDPIASNEE